MATSFINFDTKHTVAESTKLAATVCLVSKLIKLVAII